MVRRALFVLTALLLTVSCGGGQRGATPPPPASTTAAAPSPQPSPSATPFVSSADEAGAFAFTRAYLAALEKAFADGDVSRLGPYRRGSCTDCLQLEKRISDQYTAGNHVRGAQLQLQKLLLGQSGPSFAKV